MTDQQERIDILEGILTQLHHGAAPEEVQEEFNTHFSSVSAIEIAAMEQQIIAGPGPISFEDVLKLCNVHANMFKDSVDHAEGQDIDHPGHPVRVFKDENLALQSTFMRIENIMKAIEGLDPNDLDTEDIYEGLYNQIAVLAQFDHHYERKEKLFFPLLEAYGHTAPPKVMWAKDDEIRDLFNDFSNEAKNLPETDMDSLWTKYEAFKEEFIEMVFKEESILLNILLEVLSVADWYQIAQESDAYGYAIIRITDSWQPSQESLEQDAPERPASTPPITEGDPSTGLGLVENFEEEGPTTLPGADSQTVEMEEGYLTLSWQPKNPADTSTPDLNQADRDQVISLNNGRLSLNQVELVLDHLPLEVTFVDADFIFQYFNDMVDPKDMIFKRTKSQLGRNIEFCHPPKSWPKVSQLLDDLKNGRRAKEEMWFQRKDGAYVFVTYTAAFDDAGQFQGVVETVQDIQPFFDLDQPVKVELSELDED